MNLPDFTKSAKILASAIDDWNLGATGLRGRMFCDQMIITDARRIAITKVDEGSPAFGLLQVGDMILGVGGKLFSMIRAPSLARRSPQAALIGDVGKAAFDEFASEIQVVIRR